MKDFKVFVFFCLAFLSALVMAEDVAVTQDAGQWLFNLLAYVAAFVGAASLVLQGVAKITGITASTRDDELINRAQKTVAWLQRLLDRFALNPPADKARKE